MASVIAWFLQRHDCWAASTIRSYKRALESWVLSGLARAVTVDETAQLLSLLTHGPLPRQRKKRGSRTTASDKARTVSEDDAKTVFHIAAARSDIISKILSRYVKLNPHFGLRPGEWQHARVRRGRWLVVRNAKNSNGRANGNFRIFDLSPLSAADRQQIVQLIDLMRQETARGGWDKLLDVLASRLCRICRSAKLKRLCLYAFRGTAAARLKAGKLSPAEIAAVMGHASDATAQRHYPSSRHLKGWRATHLMVVDARYARRVRARYSPPWMSGPPSAPALAVG
jgi:integrase